jgi:uncharacterized protein (TIGR02145 family)
MWRTSMAFLGIIILIMPATSFAGNCGDVNNSGTINILDITYLINYVYKGGPEPDCGVGTVTDIDGNTYLTIKIGDQWWMAENLKVTHYRNGDTIPNIINPNEWGFLTTGAYCDYNDAVYGRLYNWYAVDDSRNIAPEGWHVPTDTEWKRLEMSLGMNQAEADATGWRGTDEGGKLKQSGTCNWLSPNFGATNESRFTALPGGHRLANGNYDLIGLAGLFWSSAEVMGSYAYSRYLSYGYARVHRGYGPKSSGYSVRCVKD